MTEIDEASLPSTANVSGASLVDAITKWENKVGLHKNDKGQYIGNMRYPWKLAKANLDKNFENRHEWRLDDFHGAMVNDVDVLENICLSVQKQLKTIEEKKAKKTVDKREKQEYAIGVLWLKDYRRRKDNENRKSRRAKDKRLNSNSD